MDLVLADTHAGAGDDDALIAFLSTLRPPLRRLIHLGDVFTVWLGDLRRSTARQLRVLDAFAEVRARGLELVLVAGNREIMLEPSPAPWSRVVHGEALLPLATPTLVLHGDRVRSDDPALSVLRALLASRSFRAALRAVPPSLATELAERAERELSRRSGDHSRYEGQLPLRDLISLGRRAKAAGASRVLTGHFHHERLLDVPAGATIQFAPAWFKDRRYLLLHDDGRVEAGAA